MKKIRPESIKHQTQNLKTNRSAHTKRALIDHPKLYD